MNAPTKKTESGYFIGQPVLHEDRANYRTGYVVGIESASGGGYVIDGRGMSPVSCRLIIAWNEGGVQPLAENIAGRFVIAGNNLEPISEADALRKKAEAEKRQADQYAEATRQREETTRRQAAFEAEVRERLPSWAKAVIVAEHRRDESDGQSDYYGHTSDKYLILAWSKHTRDLFPEMRKAARHAPETVEIADTGDEHREKWSMGGGYYMTPAGAWRHSTGWAVKKIPLGYGKGFTPNPGRVPMGEWRIPEGGPTPPPKTRASKTDTTPKPDTVAPASVQTGGEGATVRAGTKPGFSEVVFPGKPAADIRDELKANGFRWSRFNKCWYGKTDRLPARYRTIETPSDQIAPTMESSTDQGQDTPPAKPGQGDKFRALADKLESQIADKLADRQTNTRKRQAQAAHARVEGERLKRTQSALYALAAHHDAGTVPPDLTQIKSKKAVYELMGAKLEPVSNGFHGYHIDTGERRDDSPAARALWAMIEGKSEEQKQAEELQRKIDGLQFSDIPGYFPTPAPIVEKMLSLAAIDPASRVLEPSAGHGAIADQVREITPSVDVLELNYTLGEILKSKGHRVAGQDFLEYAGGQYDAVIMNPPFENRQDIRHIKHAARLIKPGGRVVAICSGGPRQAEQLRPLADYWEELPPATFKEAGTSVNAVLLVISAPKRTLH